jgi:plasmanylethanolamine desaturase
VDDSRSVLPAHYQLTPGQVLFSATSIAAAFLLLGWLALRIATGIGLVHWWVPPALTAGIAAADFVSGLVHWTADTWGRDDCPGIGPRLLVPFRVHHVNPGDFLRRSFIDTNGEVAFLAIPVLLAFLAVPLEAAWGRAVAVFGLGFCGIGSMTNQIHQWAHMPRVSAPVRALQSCGLFLGATEHAAHHARPYDGHYCITTGWCNGALEKIAFFRRLEWLITSATGVPARQDDRRYDERYGVPANGFEAHR